MASLTHTVGGDSNLVSFKSAARVPIESLKCHFKPKQDFNGYSKPWIGGAEINKLENEFENGYLYVSDGEPAPGDNYRRSKNFNPCLANTEYYCTFDNSATCVALFYDAEYSYISYINSLSKRTFTTPENTSYFKMYFDKDAIERGVNYPATETIYKPYENICPIEGWQGIEAYQDSIYLPKEYQRIEYLEATGTQYIYTNIPIQSPFTIDASFMYTSESGDQCLICAGYNQDNRTIRVGALGLYSNNLQNYYSGYWYAGKIYPNIKYQMNVHLEEGLQITKNNNIEINRATRSHNSNDLPIDKTKGNFGIFCMYRNQAPVYYCYAKIYSMILYGETGAEVGNFIPCRRKSDNKPGMYDTVSGEFFINQGTGEFICGPDCGKTTLVEFPAVGKNLLNKEKYSAITDTAIVFGGSFSSSTPDGSFILDAGTYTLSIDTTVDVISVVGSNGSIIHNVTSNVTENTFTIDSKQAIRILILHNNAGSADTLLSYNYQLESGDTATTYEPFKNTVYGGYIDIAKGELIQTYSYVQYDSSNLNYLWYSFNNSAAPIGIGFRKNISNDFNINTDILCDKLSILNNDMSQDFPYLYVYTNNSSVYGCIYIGTTADYPDLQTQEDVDNLCKNWVDEHGPFMIARKLKNPVTYKLSPTQLKTLLDQNYIWSNTNDITEVSYAIHDSAPIRAAKQRIAAFNARKIADLKNILRYNYLPNGATWVDEVDIDFDAGDYIEASIDVSGCTGVNENILSIGTIIDTWSVANSPSHVSGTEDIVVHFYYPSTSGGTQLADDLTYTAVADGTETKHTSNLDKITLSDTTLIIKIDKNNVYVNGTEIITGNFIYTAMTIFQEKTKLLVGSLEGSNRSHATYNYIKVVRGQ